jgi:hypothetical protein
VHPVCVCVSLFVLRYVCVCVWTSIIIAVLPLCGRLIPVVIMKLYCFCRQKGIRISNKETSLNIHWDLH